MIRSLLASAVFAIVPAGFVHASASTTPTVDAGSLDITSILKEVRKAEAGIKDLSFSFVQKTTLKGAGEPQEVAGKIRMTSKPERFRVDYESPVRQVAIYNGKTLMLYMPETGQAFIQKAGDMDLKKMLGFDPTAPLGAFEGRYNPELKGCSAGICRILFTAGDKSNTVWTMELDSGNWMVSEITFENSDMTMSIFCRDYRANSGMKPGVFRFKLPPDTEVIDGIPMLMEPGKAP